MNKKIGFIGCGNMATAIIAGILETNTLPAEQIYLYDTNHEKTDAMKKIASLNVCDTIENLCTESDFILLAVKPDVLPNIIQENKSIFEDKTVISIAAGITTKQLDEWLPKSAHYVRVMPNTPAMVGSGATALCKETNCSADEQSFVGNIFNAVGLSMWINENLINAVVGVSGSGPAYAYLFLEAMADGGVKEGLSRDVALTLAAQTLLGSAEMYLKSKKHPGELKDMVCSPKGTTIAAVQALEEGGFRATVMHAVEAAAKRSKELSES